MKLIFFIDTTEIQTPILTDINGHTIYSSIFSSYVCGEMPIKASRNTIFGGLAVAGLLAFAIYKGKQTAVSQLQYRLDKVEVQMQPTIKVILTVTITNPSTSSLGFQSFQGNISYKDTEIGIFSYLQQLTITSKSSTQFKVPITVRPINLAKVVYQLVRQRITAPYFDVVAKINTSIGTITVNQSVGGSFI